MMLDYELHLMKGFTAFCWVTRCLSFRPLGDWTWDSVGLSRIEWSWNRCACVFFGS